MKVPNQSPFDQQVAIDGGPVMFWSGALGCQLSQLKCENLTSGREPMSLAMDDLKIVHNLNRLDHHINKSADHDRYAELLWDVQQGCLERFKFWLIQKRQKEHISQLSFFIEVYLAFIYGQERAEPITLKSGPGQYVVEFLLDYLLKNTLTEPWEYALCPSAIRLFYKFLYENLMKKYYSLNMTDLPINKAAKFDDPIQRIPLAMSSGQPFFHCMTISCLVK